MEMIVFSGIQGAGKTSLFYQRFSSTHIRLGLDLVGTRNREDIILHACLAAHQSVVIDNTNPTADQRRRYVLLARAAGFRVVLYYFDVSLENALVRNAARTETQRVPEIGVRGTFAKLETPTLDEPFDEIFRVTLNADGAWIMERIGNEIR